MNSVPELLEIRREVAEMANRIQEIRRTMDKPRGGQVLGENDAYNTVQAYLRDAAHNLNRAVHSGTYTQLVGYAVVEAAREDVAG